MAHPENGQQPNVPLGANGADGQQPQGYAPQQQSFQPQPQQFNNAYGYGASNPYSYVSGQQPYGAMPGAAYAAQPQGAPYPPVSQQPQAPKKSHGWIVALVIVVALFLLSAFGMWSCSNAVGSLTGDASSSEAATLNHDAVAIITIDGTIQYDNSACSPEGLKELLDEAAENDHITAVVLRVNSGGGTATAGEEMATYVKQFREQTGKPVVVSSASLNASAAYEVSSQTDYIFTAKTSEVGAIGTIMQFVSYGELLEKLGISVDNVDSAGSKDSTYGTRELTEEERAYYQDMINQFNECFIQNVADGRGMSVDDVRALATGLPFTGTDAVENGLVDEIGTLEDAVKKAAELSGSKSTATIYLDLNSSSDDLSALLDLMGSSKMSISDIAKELNSDDRIAQ